MPLSAIVKIEHAEGSVKVDRERGARLVIVTANVRKRDLVSFVEDAKLRVQAEVKLDQGYSIKWGGQFENHTMCINWTDILILFAAFGSIKQALLILSNIPFPMIGGVFALWVSATHTVYGLWIYCRLTRNSSKSKIPILECRCSLYPNSSN